MYERDRKRKICFILFLLGRAPLHFFRSCNLFDFINRIIGRTQMQTPRTSLNTTTKTSPLSLFHTNKSLICYIIQQHCLPLLSIYTMAHHTNKAFFYCWLLWLPHSLVAQHCAHSCLHNQQTANTFFKIIGADVQGGFWFSFSFSN